MAMAASHQHDIFLSHSGQQKGFVRDLYDRLSSMGYSVFFDQDTRCLPLGQPFPDHIHSAAQTCKLAIVVLSDDFLTTRWPMIELCGFSDRLPSQADDSSGDAFTLLPLFFQLSPEDLETKENSKLKQWRKTWESFELQDRKGRISVAKCEEAVAKLRSTTRRIMRHLETEEGEASYIDSVIDGISSILPKYKLNRIILTPRKHYSGRERLCNVILEKFRQLEVQLQSQSDDINRNACIVGMYGVPGSGKSTISRFLCDSMHDLFQGNVDHFELPTKLDHHRVSEDYLNFSQRCAELLSRFTSRKDVALMDPNKVLNLLGQAISSKKMFLVLDNITQSNYESYKQILNTILDSASLGVGSRIMLVAESRAVLESLLRGRSKVMYRYAITEVPCLTEAEAMEIIRKGYPIREGYPALDEDRVTRLIRMSNSGSPSSMYIPFVFEQIGVLLKANGSLGLDKVYTKLERLWQTVLDGKSSRVQKLVAMSLKCLPDELKVLFFDIALFIIPNWRSDLSVAIPILSSMHDTVNPLIMRKKIDDLCKHCSLSIIEEKLQIHNIFIQYADSVVENSVTYVNKPIQILETATAGTSNSCDPVRVHLKCSEARTIAICAVLEWPCRYENPADDDRDHGILLQVEIGAKAKALIVRNRTSKCILGLSGDLSSLVCLEIENVHQIAILPSATGAYPSRLLRLELRRKEMYPNDQSSSSWDLVSQETQSPWMTNWQSTPLFQCSLVASYMELVTSLASSGRMAGLRELVLANAGISRLEDIGRHCPQLEDLEVSDEDQELMFLSIRSAPKLKRLITGQSFDYKRSNPYWQGINHKGEYWPTKSSKLILDLPGCPELRQAWVDVCLFEQVEVMGPLPSGLRHFGLGNHRSFEVMPTTWISPSAQLERLKTMELFRSKVEMLNFTKDCLGVLPGLRSLCIHSCADLKHLSIHPSCVPNLRGLHVADCRKLEVFQGLENLVKDQLLWFILRVLPHLQCDLSFGSVQVERIAVVDCPGVKVHHNLLEYSKGLKSILFKATPVATVQQDFGIKNVIMSMGKYIEDIYIESVTVHRMQKDGVAALNSDQHTTINTPVAIDGSTGIKIVMQEEEEEEDDDDDDDDDEISVSACSDHHAKKGSNIPSKTRHGSAAGSSSLCLPVLQVLHWFYWRIIVRVFHGIAGSPDVPPARSSSECKPVLQSHLTFLEAQYPFLQNLSLSGLESLQMVEDIQHLHILCRLHLSDLPSLTRVSGKWPASIQHIRCFECPKLEVVPCLEHTPELSTLVCHNCAKLRAVEGRCPQMLKRVLMSGDLVIALVGCESMEVFPMQEIIEELGKTREEYKYPWRNRRVLMRVSGSKFATVEVMQRWLLEARLGSSLVDAALHGLVWECVKKDSLDARNVLEDCFSAIYEFAHSNSHALQYVLQYFHDVLFPTDFRKSLFSPHLEEHQVSFFKEWIFHKFSLTPMEDHSKKRPKPDWDNYLTYLSLQLNEV